MHTWDNVALSGGGDGLGFLHPGGGVDRHAPVAPSADLHVLGRQLDDVLFPRVGVGDGVGGAVRELHLSINNKRANQGYGTYGKDACCWDDYIRDARHEQCFIRGVCLERVDQRFLGGWGGLLAIANRKWLVQGWVEIMMHAGFEYASST